MTCAERLGTTLRIAHAQGRRDDSLAQGGAESRLPGSAVVPEPDLPAQSRQSAGAQAPSREGGRVQGQGHLPRLASLAPGCEQLARREGPAEDRGRRAALAAASRA